MSDHSQDELTQAMLAAFAGTPDPRLRRLFAALIRHLHAFAREVDLTPDEWMAGLDFLKATGRKCVGPRHEFILLSDTLGLSMVVVALTQARASGGARGATEATVQGPFYWHGALLGVWSGDGDGKYDLQLSDTSQMRARGRFRADEQGRYWFWSIRPTCYPIPDDGPVVDFEAHAPGTAVDGRVMYMPCHSASFDLRLAPAQAWAGFCRQPAALRFKAHP